MINEQRWKMNYIGLLEAGNIFSENVNFGCQAACIEIVCVCVCVCVFVRLYILHPLLVRTYAHTTYWMWFFFLIVSIRVVHGKVDFLPRILHRVYTPLLWPITAA